MQRLSRTSATKTAVLLAAVLLALVVSASTALGATTIFMKGGKSGLRFVGPETVAAGEDLKVLNQTDPKRVGPHTFSLVTKASLPKTRKARQRCFVKGHICGAIAAWHGVKGNGPVSQNPAKAGLLGWDTEGSSPSDKGDSWFTGNKPGTSIVQKVTVDTLAVPTRIHFLCAIHPWMQGSIEVQPPTVPVGG